MSQPTSYKGRFESPDQIKSVVVNFDRPVSGEYPVFKFPAAGRVLGGAVFADVAASGTNLIKAGLRNGGVTGAGTIQTAAQTTGTMIAGSAYGLTIDTTGPEAFKVGELVMLDLTTTDNPTDIAVQVDYVIDPF